MLALVFLLASGWQVARVVAFPSSGESSKRCCGQTVFHNQDDKGTKFYPSFFFSFVRITYRGRLPYLRNLAGG
jgi:hypothetical protein